VAGPLVQIQARSGGIVDTVGFPTSSGTYRSTVHIPTGAGGGAGVRILAIN
jgi:hypothetical protein